jgi:hypothetical protein
LERLRDDASAELARLQSSISAPVDQAARIALINTGTNKSEAHVLRGSKRKLIVALAGLGILLASLAAFAAEGVASRRARKKSLAPPKDEATTIGPDHDPDLDPDQDMVGLPASIAGNGGHRAPVVMTNGHDQRATGADLTPGATLTVRLSLEPDNG